ncbi:VOC family protein [Serinicoccus sp. CUA-874]|uniref:VOC family protein n=1 Tax=Serinicoccus sp. CUA-874 TaxID=1517939 RepID=UPI001300DF70|nr:VOC family protein [Serinicoccus sp. CUA-874]
MFTFDDSEGNTVIVLEFYRAVRGREPDASLMPGLAEWHVGGGALQVTVDGRRSGGGLVTLQVTDLGPTVAALSDRGVEVRAQEGTAVAGFASLDDPDGNLVTLVQTAP